MGHYWSEMAPDKPARNPTALDSMDFFQPYSPPFYDAGVRLWVHRPCMKVFFVNNKNKLDDAIWNHGNNCHANMSTTLAED